MTFTKNIYSYPVKLDRKVKIFFKKSRAHIGRLSNAIDFIVSKGTQIMAALDGIVVDVKQDSDVGGESREYDEQGNYIEIGHENGEYSIYEHIKKNGSLVRVGDKVNRGQIIGYSGATGWLDKLGPHLHFDVHHYPEGAGPNDYISIKIRFKNKYGTN